MKFRAFIAVPLDTDMSRELERIAAGLGFRDKKDEIRWTPRENLHLTLAFIGDILQADAVRLESTLERALSGIRPFRAEFSELSYFPFNRKPRLIAALVHSSEELRYLHRKTRKALRELGLPVESRAFVPHVTLGRVRGRGTPWLQIEPQPLTLEFEIRRVQLMRSELDQGGARYFEVFAAGLS